MSGLADRNGQFLHETHEFSGLVLATGVLLMDHAEPFSSPAPGDFIFYAHFKMADCHGSICHRAIRGYLWLSMVSEG